MTKGKIVWVLILSVGLFACRSTEKVGRKNHREHRVIHQEPVGFDRIIANGCDYHSFSSRIHLKMKIGTRSFSSAGSLKIIHDRMFWLSLQPLAGIEMFRVVVTNDSIYVLNKVNQKYSAESLSRYRAKLPVDISLSGLEALFLNRLFIPGERSVNLTDARRFDYRLAEDGPELSPRKQREIKSTFRVDSEGLITRTELGLHSYRLFWDYRAFEKQRGGWFPTRSEIAIEKDGIRDWAKGSVAYSRMIWDGVTDINLRIPLRYERIPLEYMLKSLKLD